MKSYRFRLDRALGIRRLQASLERAHFEQAVGQVRRIERERELLAAASHKESSSVRSGSFHGYELAGLDSFLDKNARIDQSLVRQLAEAGARLNVLRARLIEADRKVKVLEKLEERAQRKWKAEFDGEMEKLAGESYLMRWKPPPRG